ncbi:hypothetical protein CARUB_v10000298mg [Capsella rubella]|uniref:Mechanosensitive ion channel protein n=1 Tax=Capsella rubella TaxID=81985 RepID=R0GT40_9BRAS|nr:mechanosensitive ion channel protein 9 [Capsella rubella]EOA20024.1 hypothetical protein CARUB_v10000298mg [Capsella rubella]
MAEKRASNGEEVVINVSDKEESKDSIASPPFNPLPSPEADAAAAEKSKPMPISIPPPEIYKFAGSVHKPPKTPSPNNGGLVRRKSVSRSVYSKSKSRFGEQQSFRYDHNREENGGSSLREQFGAASSFARSSFDRASPNNKSNRSITSQALSKVDEDETDENEEIYRKVKLHRSKRSAMTFLALLELVLFMGILATLVVSLTIDKVKDHTIWGLELWKWCVLVMVTLSGLFLTNWFMHFAVFLIEKNYLLKKKVLYFVHGLKKNVQVFIWFGLILIAWICLFDDDDRHSRKTKKFLDFITATIITLLVGSVLFLVKTFALKVLASKFNVRNFFERIQESVFHQYVLQTLSGPPLIEEAENVGRVPSTGHLSFTSTKNGKAKDKKVIDMGKVHRMKQEKVSAWTMRVLIEAVGTSGISTISSTLDEVNNRKERTDKEITSEMEAVAAAYEIFNNVAKPNQNFIEEDDLLRFMIKEEVDLVLPLIEGAADTGKITRKAFTEWVVNVYTSRKTIGHSLNDTKTAVKQLDKLISGVLTVATLIVWLVLLDIASTKLLLLFSSQFVGLAFMIGSTCKNIFESFIFVFVMHPYDVGDRCVVDGVMLLVEEIDLLTTVFLKIDNEKVFYPNSVLITKPISNFYRSPDMGDYVDFGIAFSTPAEKIGTLKEKIKEYLVANPQHWYPEPLVMVRSIENVNKLVLNVLVQHTINFQVFVEKSIRRTALIIAVKKILEDLEIDYTLLPQDVRLTGQN